MRNRAFSLVMLASLVAMPVTAQSLFNSAGMGLPVEALDGRARAMGNLGIGLPDASFLPTDPAAMARLFLPTGVMASQPSWVDYAQEGAGSGSFQGTRFPLLGMAYPVFSGMMSVQIGSFLDQHFIAEIPGSVDLQGTTVASSDIFEQDGSVSNLNVGYARMVNARTAVGVTFGRYAGSLVRGLSRTVIDPELGIAPYVESGKWSYTGHSVTAGVNSDVTDGIQVAASVQIPTSLSADADENTTGADGSFNLPVQYRLGASAQLGPGLVLTASTAFADWSSVDSQLNESARASSANGFGIGIELSRARLLGKEAPLRFGYRRTGLPFSFESGDASESVFAGGFGLALNETNEVLLAGADFALERGTRSGGGVVEKFWRLTISMSLSGS